MAKDVIPSDSSRRSLPNDGSSRRVSTAPPYGDRISATASRSLRPERDTGTSGNPATSQTTARTSVENKKAKVLKRNRSPTSHSTNSPEPSNHIDLVSNSGESSRGTPQPSPSKNTRSAVRNRNSITTDNSAADESVEMDVDSASASKAQTSVGKKNQRGKKRARGSTKEQSVDESKESKKKKSSEDADKNKDSQDDEENWEVEAILSSRTVNKVREYLVKWEGNWDDTWEAVDNLVNCQDMVRGYEEKQEAKKRKFEEDKKLKEAAKEKQKLQQEAEYKQKKKETDEQAEKKKKEVEAEKARKEEARKVEEEAKREERRKEKAAKEERAKTSVKDKPKASVSQSSFPVQRAIKVQAPLPRLKPTPTISPSPKRKQRATSSESTFSVSKSPTPEPTLILSVLRAPKVDNGVISISPTFSTQDSIPLAATKRSAMDRGMQVVKILAHKPKLLDIKRLEDVDFLINYAGFPNEFVSYETCLEKVPAHLCEYLAQNGPLFYLNRR